MAKPWISRAASAAVASLLLAGLVPLSLCDRGGECPMRQQARAGKAAGAPCIPGPAFDCCKGDQAPPASGSERPQVHAPQSLVSSAGPGVLPEATASQALDPAAAAAWITPPTASADAAAPPLYTLLATLLL